MFCITCGGLPCLETSSSPHHIKSHSNTKGRTLCKTWRYDASRPKARPRPRPWALQPEGNDTFVWDGISFFVSVALWIAFIIYFGHTLRPAIDFTFQDNSLKSAVWYYMSAGPAFMACCLAVLQNQVELYSPVNEDSEVAQDSSSKGSDRTAKNPPMTTHRTLQQKCFKHAEVRSRFTLWLRILVLQWRRQRYPILVQDATIHRFW